jgi:uncharacterized membrane protein (UPF0127 family)
MCAEVKKPPSRKPCAGFREITPKGYDAPLEITPKGYDTPLMQIAQLTKSDGTLVCERCALAVRPWSRMRGLLGRASLETDEGMLFRPTGSIHMFFMRFAIDAVFLDRDLVVIDVVRGLKPWRTASRSGAKVVVELAEGGARDLHAGDRLSLSTD